MTRITRTGAAIPSVDVDGQDVITDEQARLFLESGLIVLRHVVGGAELEALRRETGPLVDRAVAGDPDDPHGPDFRYRTQTASGNPVAYRVEYVLDKSPACRALLGHPFILRTVEKLQGRNFIPTYDALVFKLAGEAPVIPWHRDASADLVGDTPIFNVDVYLDGSDLTNCVWGIPGSNSWPSDRVDAFLHQRGTGPSFDTTGATPILMAPGDALIHSILALHGSGPAQSWFRRVLYYEFRSAETELRLGPHHPRYVPLKQRVLLDSLDVRRGALYAAGEEPFIYRPELPPAPADARGATFRFPHEQYWR